MYRTYCFNILLLVLFAIGNANLEAQDPRALSWFFGRSAGVAFSTAGIAPTRWNDTAYAGAGMLWDQTGKPIVYAGWKTTFNAAGDTLGNCRYYYNLGYPAMLMFRKPGSRDTVYAYQTYHGHSLDYRLGDNFLSEGSATINIIDLEADNQRGKLFLESKTIVSALNVPNNPDRVQIGASACLVPHINGRDLWLIAPMASPSGFRVFHVTRDGVKLHQDLLTPEFPQITSVGGVPGRVILDSLPVELRQYDVTLRDADSIRNSKQIVVPFSKINAFAGLQRGPDNRIYVAQRDKNFVSRINKPNEQGTACEFERKAVVFPDTNTICMMGFPTMMPTISDYQLRIPDLDLCQGDTAVLPLQGTFVTDSVVWSFGGSGKVGVHYFDQPGAYQVSATMYVASEPKPPVYAWVYVHENPTYAATTPRRHPSTMTSRQC